MSLVGEVEIMLSFVVQKDIFLFLLLIVLLFFSRCSQKVFDQSPKSNFECWGEALSEPKFKEIFIYEGVDHSPYVKRYCN